MWFCQICSHSSSWMQSVGFVTEHVDEKYWSLSSPLLWTSPQSSRRILFPLLVLLFALHLRLFTVSHRPSPPTQCSKVHKQISNLSHTDADVLKRTGLLRLGMRCCKSPNLIPGRVRWHRGEKAQQNEGTTEGGAGQRWKRSRCPMPFNYRASVVSMRCSDQ